MNRVLTVKGGGAGRSMGVETRRFGLGSVWNGNESVEWQEIMKIRIEKTGIKAILQWRPREIRL